MLLKPQTASLLMMILPDWHTTGRSVTLHVAKGVMQQGCRQDLWSTPWWAGSWRARAGERSGLRVCPRPVWVRRLLLLLHAQGPQLDVGRLQPGRLQHQVRRRAAGPVRHSEDALQLHPRAVRC